MESDWLPLISAGVGTLIGAALSSLGETRRWRRQFTSDFYQDQRAFFGEAITALDAIFTAVRQADLARQGKRTPVPPDRFVSTDQEWRRIFSLRGVMSSANVQGAIVAFDRAKADAIDAINAGHDADAQLADLSARHKEMLGADASGSARPGSEACTLRTPFPRTSLAPTAAKGRSTTSSCRVHITCTIRAGLGDEWENSMRQDAR